MSGERYVFMMNLIEGQEAEYQRRHDEIWPEMEEALRRCGYTDYSLHRRGTLVVGVATMVPDAATAMARMAAEPVNDRWNASFEGILVANATGGYGSDLPQVWRLNEERGDD